MKCSMDLVCCFDISTRGMRFLLVPPYTPKMFVYWDNFNAEITLSKKDIKSTGHSSGSISPMFDPDPNEKLSIALC